MSLLSPEELTLLHTDSKYKNYVSSIEKCLKNFESSSEWADLISSLGKLKKVIHSSPKYQYIPKRVNVCKRLSQCLHPALPSGVHLKALEVYTCIFQNIGADNLAKDLFLYSSGLFPLLANAALSVKPVLLSLYETYFLPLKKSLRPGLTGLLIALLPGLEEGSDFYQRTFNLIKSICLAQSDNSTAQIANINNYVADDKYFHSCVWSAIISESSIRFPAIQFVLSNYEVKKRSGSINTDDQLYLIGNSIDLMINAICCCLQDANSLVQRSILDLVATCLPMNTKNVTRSDKIQLITVAIHVVLRRDMTLNRRIYSWLTGNGSNSEEMRAQNNDKNYFDTHSKSLLIQSIKMLLNKKEASSILYLLNDEVCVPASQPGTITVPSVQASPSTMTTLKLIKIISNLVERQEIGQAIIDDILLDLLFYIYKEYSFLNLNSGLNVQGYFLSFKKANSNFHHVQQQQQQMQNSKDSNELKKATCNFLFHSFQIFFIWDFCASKFESICKSHTSSNRLESDSSHTITTDSVYAGSSLNPAQLCDLYEFILDLLANSDVYNEIQTDHLPIMLKRIIQTITCYCENMTNQDLSKSLLLCLKILNKVVPKITLPESNINPSTKARKLSVKKSECDNNSSACIEDVVKQVIDDLIINLECAEPLAESCELSIRPTSTDHEPDDNLVIEQCLASLKKLTHTFIESHLFIRDQLDQVDKAFRSMFSLTVRANFSTDDGYLCDSDINNLSLIKLKSNSLQYLQSYQILNKLVIRMLFFPREQQPAQVKSVDENFEQCLNSFEDWLKDLFVIASCSHMSNSKQLFELQSVSLNTLIELIHLSESINSQFDKRSHADPKCLLQTIFSTRQINLVFNHSKFGHVTAQMLWSHLCPVPNQLEPMANCTDKRASILFCLLHELLPNNLCEEIIVKNFLLTCLNYTINSDLYTTCNLRQKIDSFKRFTRLWHWSRELNTSNDLDHIDELSVSTIKYGKLTKTFEKFLVILFDHMTKEDTPGALSKLIQDWLISCITEYNDLGRLVDLLLVSLVHPSTARVSVQHFIDKLLNADETKPGLNDDQSDNSSFESKVYAISNEDGNVRYHVNNNESLIKPINQQQQQQQQQQPQQQQIFMLTSLEQSTQSNKPVKNPNIELPLSILNASSLSSGISLRINPFLADDEDDDDNETDNARLLENYKAIKLKQGSKSASQAVSANTSPSLPSMSPNPADQSIQSIEKSNRNSLETNQSEYLSDEDEHEEEDEEEADDDDELDDEDYEAFENSDDELNDDETITKKYSTSFGQFRKNRKLKLKEKLKKSSSSTLIEKMTKSSDKLAATISHNNNNNSSNSNNSVNQTFILKKKDFVIDLQNTIESHYSHLFVYTNCTNIQAMQQQGNCILVVSKFSNNSYDHVKISFVLKCVEHLITKSKNEFLFSLARNTLSNQNLVHSVHNGKLIDLIHKHLRSIHGENFYLSSKNVVNLNVNTMTYLEALSLILLFYVRSYYPCSRFVIKNAAEQAVKLSKANSFNSVNSEQAAGAPPGFAAAETRDSLNQFEENRNIQIYCLKIMGKIFSQLISLISIDNKPIHTQIGDYLNKLKIQQTFLHLFHCTIQQPVAHGLANLLLRENNSSSGKQVQRAYVAELLNCLESLIQLEKMLMDYNLKYVKSGLLATSSSSIKNTDTDQDDFVLGLVKKASSLPQAFKYIPSQTIFNQSMFVSSVLYYLKSMSLVEYHLDILKLIGNTLPSSGASLKSISTYIIEQLCRNLLYITNGGTSTSGSSSSNYVQPMLSYMSQVSLSINIPDIIINMIKKLGFILNYCLISGQNLNSVVFNFGAENADHQSKLFRQFHTDNELNQLHAKESLIHLFPSILSSMVQVWQRCNLLLSSNVLLSPCAADANNTTTHQLHCSWILGHPAVIKQCITDLLNPIAQFNKFQFMHAIGSVWGERRKKSRLLQEHRVIIELIRSLKSFSLSVIIQNIIDILKQSNSSNSKEKKKSPLNIWLLQFFHTYLDYYLGSLKSPAKYSQLHTEQLSQNDLAACLCNFFKEVVSNSTTSNFAPACYFQLFRILHDSVNNLPILVDDKKYTKDIQEATHKLFELCNSIVASSLQQTTWLRKNFAVKLNPQPDLKSQSSSSQLNQTNLNAQTNSTSLLQTNLTNLKESSANNSTTTNGISTPSVSNARSNFSDLENEITSNFSDHGSNLNSIDPMNALIGDLNDSNNNLAYSLQALNILAEFLAKTLDIVYKSEEKDRLVIPILISLMSNLWPYLKTHSVANKNNFRAASHLLMTLTVYPYTRKTWKKEVFEMLFDNFYFHVDSPTLEYSKIIVDNLISNDRAMFKDVLTRVTYQQSGGLFTSKEQESEQKAQLLKRLAFVIFSSEKDQYQRNMPEIQECIAHVLKLVQSANLYSTLFLLFRILFLRISSKHLTALWPTIITELVLILLQIEQDLSEDQELNIKLKRNGTKYSNLDHIASQMSTQNWNNSKLHIYLSACKLIDLILTLPSPLTPQFQLYKWSFINTDDTINFNHRDQFVPYLNKINNLLKNKYPTSKSVTLRSSSGGPLLRFKRISSLVDLRAFFEQVTTHQFVHNSNQTHTITNQQLQQNSLLMTTNLKLFEASVHEDFLEGWIQ